MPGRISPNFEETKLDNPSNADVVDVLEDRIRGWILEPARGLAASATGHIPALSLLLTYFEGIWSYIVLTDSRGRSREFFEAAFCDVFASCQESPALIRRVGATLYSDARCGLFHDGMARHRIYVGTIAPEPLVVTLPRLDGRVDPTGEIQSIVINVEAFCASVDQHLTSFLSSLRSDLESEKTRRFVDFCREQWRWDKPPVVIGLPEPGQVSSPSAG